MSGRVPNAVEAPGTQPERGWLYIAAAAIGLSASATLIVLGNVAAGTPRHPDEDSWAHLFQLAMAAQLPRMLSFLATADWNNKRRLVLLLVAQIVSAAAAFAALAYAGY